MEEKAGILVFSSAYEKTGELDKDVKSRLQTTLALWANCSVSEILATGGVHCPDLTSNRVIADDMKDWFVTRGISWHQIFLERGSYDTWTNLIKSLPIIKEREWTKVYLVSNRRHLRRISGYLKKLKKRDSSMSHMEFVFVASPYLNQRSILWEIIARVADIVLPLKIKKYLWTRIFPQYRHLKQ